MYLFHTPPGWDANPLQGYTSSQALNSLVPINFVQLGGDRHCENIFSTVNSALQICLQFVALGVAMHLL